MFELAAVKSRKAGPLSVSLTLHVVLGAVLVVGSTWAVSDPPDPAIPMPDYVAVFLPRFDEPEPIRTAAPRPEPVKAAVPKGDPLGGRRSETPAATEPADEVVPPTSISDSLPSSSTGDDVGGTTVVGPGLVDAPPGEIKGDDDERPHVLIPGGSVLEPVLIHSVDPVYPNLAIRARLQGFVLVEAVISKDGTVTDVRMLETTSPLFNASAIDAVRKWRYRPATYSGRAVPVYLTVRVTFTLRG